MSAFAVSGSSEMSFRSLRSSWRVAPYSRGSTYHLDFQVLLIPSLIPIGFTFCPTLCLRPLDFVDYRCQMAHSLEQDIRAAAASSPHPLHSRALIYIALGNVEHSLIQVLVCLQSLRRCRLDNLLEERGSLVGKIGQHSH